MHDVTQTNQINVPQAPHITQPEIMDPTQPNQNFQGRSIQSFSLELMKKVPWEKVRLTVLALFGIGIAASTIYAGSQIDFSGPFASLKNFTSFNQTAYEESTKKSIEEVRELAFQSCSNSPIPNNFKEFEAIHDQFIFDPNIYPPFEGKTVENIKKCTFNCELIGWTSEICRDKLSAFNNFASDRYLNMDTYRKINVYPQDLDSPELKVHYFEIFLLPKISKSYAQLLPNNQFMAKYV